MSAARAKAIDLAQHYLVDVNQRNGISNTGDAHAEVEVLIDSIIYAAVEASVEQSLKRLKRHAGLYAGQPRIGDMGRARAEWVEGKRGTLSSQIVGLLEQAFEAGWGSGLAEATVADRQDTAFLRDLSTKLSQARRRCLTRLTDLVPAADLERLEEIVARLERS